MTVGVAFDPSAGIPAWARFYREVLGQAVPAWTPDEDAENYKRPMLSSWREFETTRIPDATFERWYGPGGQHVLRRNIGLITGAASGNVFVIDLDQRDGKDGIGIWLGLLALHNNDMELSTPIQRTGGGGRQILLRWPDGSQPPTFKTPIGIDIRGEGGFAVLPPSLHASGNEYAWEPHSEPWSTAIYTAPQWVVDWVLGLRDEHAANAGQPHTRTPSGEDFNKYGARIDGREDRMSRMVWGVALDLRREFPDGPVSLNRIEAERERCWATYLRDTRTRLLDAPDNETGLEREGRGRTAFIERWSRALGQWDTKLKEEAGRPKPAPPQRPFNQGRFAPWLSEPVPPFPLDCLTPILQAYVRGLHESIGGDLSACVMAALTTLSAALDQRIVLKAQRYGDWFAPPRLWTLLVGGSSSRKTPIMTATQKPLRQLEAVAHGQYQRDYAAWKERGEGLEPAPPRRFIVGDTTPEALCEVLAGQDCGILLSHDEATGFIGLLDKFDSTDTFARSFYLRLHDGGPYRMDRVGHSRNVSNLIGAFIGGVQPSRLQDLKDLTTDGLIQRFLPTVINRGVESEDANYELAAMRYADLVQFLTGLKPQTYILNDAAMDEMRELRHELHRLERDAEGVNEAFVSWAVKLVGYSASLTVLLHILENRDDAPFVNVGTETVLRVRNILFNFIVPHGYVFYSRILAKESSDDVLKLSSFLLVNNKDRFVASDIRFGARLSESATQTPWMLQDLIHLFVSNDWLVPEDQKGTAWILQPWVREEFAERRAVELERKAKIAKRFRPKRGETLQ